MNTCANANITQCSGYVTQGGNILCDSCIDARKSLIKDRRDHNIDSLLSKNCVLENEMIQLKLDNAKLVKSLNETSTQISLLEKQVRELTDSNNQLITITDTRYKDYNIQLEKDGKSLLALNERLCKENEELVKERGAYEMTHEQIKLDNQQFRVENNTFKNQLEHLLEQNKLLTKENKESSKKTKN